MKRVRNGIRLGTALALGLGAHATSASQLNLLPILQITGQHTDNVFFAETNKQSDTFYLVTPGIALDYSSRNFVGSIAYQLGLQRHSEFKERDNNVHRIDATAGFNLRTGWYLNASDNLYITSDPLAFDASGDRIQRDSFTYNRFSPAIAYNFGHHDIRAGFRYDRIDIDYKTLVDSYQNGYGGSLSGKLGGKSTLTVDYFEFKRRFARQLPTFNVGDYTGRRYGLRLDRNVSSRLSLNGFVGYEQRKFDDNALQEFSSVILEATVTGEFPDIFSWTLSGSQRLNDLAVRGAYKVKRVNLDLRKSVAEKVRLEANGFLQRSDNRQLLQVADFKGLRLEGQYLVAKFLNIWLGYEYLDRKPQVGSPNDVLISPFSENRVNFGLSLSYGL